MKGFYAFAAALAVGSLVSASAFNFTDIKAKKVDAASIHTESVEKVASPKQHKALKAKASRADEWTPTKFTTLLYVDHFEWYDKTLNGYEDDVVNSSCAVTFTEENGKKYISNLFDYTENYGFAPVEYTETENGIAIEMGQVVYTQNGMDWMIAALGNDGIVISGEIELLGYSNAIAPDEENDYWLGFYVVQGSEGKGWEILANSPIFFEPNATITFTNTTKNGVTEVNNRIYIEYEDEGYENETANGTIVADQFYISNVTQFNSGFMISYVVWKEDGYGLIENNLVYPPLSLGGGQYTSRLEMASQFYDEEKDKNYYTLNSEGYFDFEENTFTFPYTWEDSPGEYNAWYAISEEGYYLGDNTIATITIDKEESEDPGDGISDVKYDNNGVVEIYNLQGMKVANPEAGQVYIFKNGNKATKSIVR